MKTTLLACVAIMIASGAYAFGYDRAPAVFAPANPSNLDEITVTFAMINSCTGFTEALEVTPDRVVRMYVEYSCIIGPPPYPMSHSDTLGPLPPGVYTFEIYWRNVESGPIAPYTLRSSQPLIVSPLPVPIGGPAATTALIAALIGAAWFALGVNR